MLTTDFGDVIADRMQLEHKALAARWFERLLGLLPVDAREIFPTQSLLDHVPALILEISAYIRHPAEDAIAANTAILEKAKELGALRHAQRASLHQLLREYQILGNILATFVVDEIEELGVVPTPRETVLVVSRLHQAVNVLSQATIESFVTLYTQTIEEQRERLEQFTRMAAHEWRQPLNALQLGVSLLTQVRLDRAGKRETLEAVQRSAARLVELTHRLEFVARVRDSADNPVVQKISASAIVEEAARQLHEMATDRAVEIRIAADLPELTIDVGRLELIFVNLLSNAIKYSDPGKPVRYVDVSGRQTEEGRCVFTVRDNGIGIPKDSLPTIFQRFTRAHADREEGAHIGGIGLGLSIVNDCVKAVGGEVDVQSTEGEGTAFMVTLPASPR